MNRSVRISLALLLCFGLMGLFATACGPERSSVVEPLSPQKGGGGGGPCGGDEFIVIVDPAYGAAQIAIDNGWTLTSYDPVTNIGKYCSPNRASIYDPPHNDPPPNGAVEIELNVEITGNPNVPGDGTLGIWDGESVTGAQTGNGMEVTNYMGARPYADGRFIRVAMIDTGINTDHPEFDPTLIDYNGPKADAEDIHGHGTATAGVIHQLAPRAVLIPINVFDPLSGGATVGDVADALNRALQDDVDIVNLSLRFTKISAVVGNLLEALANQGVVVFASAGNVPSPAWPGTHTDTVSVTGTDDNDALVSGWAPSADYGAPGVDILSFGLGDDIDLDPDYYVRGTGTSMSTAIASGIMALYLQGTDETNRATRIGHFEWAADLSEVTPAGTVVHGRVDGGKVFWPFQ